MKFTFVGAGSIQFTRKLVRDLLTFPAFEESTICLFDIDEKRLAFAREIVGKIIQAFGSKARLVATLDRRQALEGADGVVCTIQGPEWEIRRLDLEIPMKYGVNQNIGDTRGPGGVFRFLRTAPAMMEIVRDIERYCPDAYFLNYTNPMVMLMRAMQNDSKVKMVGLCHSVQGTAAMLARWIGAPIEEITYFCAGINHQAWYLEFKWNGKDAYPLIREAVGRPEIYNEEQVRNEMFLHLGYYVTESSGHNSEYNAWFRKREDLLEKYCTHGTGWNPGLYGLAMRRSYNWREMAEKIKQEPVDTKRGNEYAASIFNAVLGDGTMFEFNGNIRNNGLIDNLPHGCGVEVPILASKRGFDPIKVGNLPPQLALLNNINARCEELAVEAFLTGDPWKVYYALCYDPLTSAVLSLAEIKEMVNEMLEVNKPWLPQFKSHKL